MQNNYFDGWNPLDTWKTAKEQWVANGKKYSRAHI